MHDQNDDNQPSPSPFIQRWSQRKQESRKNVQSGQPDVPVEQPPEQAPQPAQQTLPPVESLHEDSDIGMFLADGVSESLQRQALRKLFRFGKFNICDGLDDYADDYTIFKPLEKLASMQDTLQDIGDRLQTRTSSDLESAPASESNIFSEEETDPDGAASIPGTDDEEA